MSKDNLNEFRKDLVSGEWVLFATNRAKRPDPDGSEKKEKFHQPKEDCPFEDPVKFGNELVWSLPAGSDWKIMVVKNKFPVVKEKNCDLGRQTGPFDVREAVGAHDVFVFRDHNKKLADFSSSEMTETIGVYKKRHQEISSLSNCTQFVLLFHNSGREAGASLFHPHTQIMSLPIVPPDMFRSLAGARRFFTEHKKRVYDLMIEWEIEQQKRVICENKAFIAFCPFVSHSPYEVRIFPKNGQGDFDRISLDEESYLAEIMSVVLKKIRSALDDPAYNFFIHTVPLKNSLGDGQQFYTWHVEILPRFSMVGSFELGTRIDINIVDPDEAAEKLRNY